MKDVNITQPLSDKRSGAYLISLNFKGAGIESPHKIKSERLLLRLTRYWAKRWPRTVTWILSITGLQQQLKRLLIASVCSHYQMMVVHRQHEETAGRRKSMHIDTAAIRQIFFWRHLINIKHNDKMWSYTWDLQRLQPQTWVVSLYTV